MGKVKVSLPSQGHEGPEGVTCIAPLSLISALDVGGWSTPRPGIVRVPIVYEAGWATGPVWTGEEDLVPRRNSILDPSSP